MNKSYRLLLFFVLSAQIVSGQHEWTWMSGNKSANVHGVYGVVGVSQSSNVPGSRAGAASWIDKQGNFWLFGGLGYGEKSGRGFLNDLWKYTPSNNQWTWMGGSKIIQSPGIYGNKRIASSENIPGARHHAVSWMDKDGNFWLFGGKGIPRKKRDGKGNDNGGNGNGGNGNGGNGNGGNGNGGNGNDGGTDRGGDDRDDEDGEGDGSADEDEDDDKDKNKDNDKDKNKDEEKDDEGKNKKDKDNRGDDEEDGRGGDDDDDDGDDSILEEEGEGLLNDLWMYSPSTGRWSWISGSDVVNATGQYGQRLQTGSTNHPGARFAASGWKDEHNNLWIFGGHGYSSEKKLSDLNDVWKYSVASNEWTWMNGNEKGYADTHYGSKSEFDGRNTPGGRRGSAGVTEGNGFFWIFGGAGRGLFGDLWKYDAQLQQWAWMSGSKTPGASPQLPAEGVPASEIHPGARTGAVAWTNSGGTIWLFGGSGYGGNNGSGFLNSIWKYNSTDDTWEFLNGEAARNAAPAFGTKGSPHRENTPGGTSNPVHWQDHEGNLWVFGGESRNGLLNQLWKFNAKCAVSGSISPATASICEGGEQLLTATGGTEYEWRYNDQVINGERKATLRVTKAGTYSVVIKNNHCSAPASNTAVVVLATAPAGTISPGSATICEGGSQTLTATGGTSYQWRKDGNVLEGQSTSTLTVNEPGTYSVDIVNGDCRGPASNEVVVTMKNTGGIRYPDTTISANVPLQLMAQTSGLTYNWLPAEGLDNPASPAPVLTTSSGGTYLVQITTASGCVMIDTQVVKIAGDEREVRYVPSAFTPNGNHANDLLRPMQNIISIEYFKVYNRWGMLMFETTEINSGWDGRYRGVVQPADTYTWVLAGTNADGEAVNKSGKTLLIR